MANDERRRGEQATEWRGDDGFGGGWGNQVPRPHRLADRDYGPRFGEGGGWYGPDAADGGYLYGGPGVDADSGGTRFDRAGRGRSAAQPIASVSGQEHAMGAGARFGEAARRHDPHYADWRYRQMAALDRDYEDYRRENQSNFDREFGAWRERRGAQREAVGRVREHMEVVGKDGGHVGLVDCTRGDRIVLTKSDEAAGAIHHAIPCAWIDRVDDKIVLDLDAEEARSRWQSENRSRALFEREDLGQRGPHVLNRSFAGTYRDEE
jgi:hypothetical protein